LTASVVVDPVGLWATRRVVHKSKGCVSGSHNQFGVIAQISVLVVTGQAMGTMEDRQPAIRVFVLRVPWRAQNAGAAAWAGFAE
jgi:hypothetical protein